MAKITQVLEKVYTAVTEMPLGLSLYIVWGAYAAICISATALALFNKAFKKANKSPFLYFTNAFAAVTLGLLLTEKPLSFSVLCAVVFWCFGYLIYGLLLLLSRRKNKGNKKAVTTISYAKPHTMPQITEIPLRAQPAVKGNVRLEHASSVTEKLLLKELGRGDRQEVERIKTSLALLKTKQNLTPEDNERLNENFNTLLKLMAKYNV